MRGRRHNPVLHSQNRKLTEKTVRLERRVESLASTITEQKAALDHAVLLAQRANEAGYQRALAEAKGAQRTAAETGDLVAHDQATEVIDEHGAGISADGASSGEGARETGVGQPLRTGQPLQIQYRV